MVSSSILCIPSDVVIVPDAIPVHAAQVGSTLNRECIQNVAGGVAASDGGACCIFSQSPVQASAGRLTTPAAVRASNEHPT